MRTIGENIKAIREQSGLTQDALAEAADVNRVTLVKFHPWHLHLNTHGYS